MRYDDVDNVDDEATTCDVEWKEEEGGQRVTEASNAELDEESLALVRRRRRDDDRESEADAGEESDPA